MRKKQREAELQRAAARLLDALGLLWFHTPNGGRRDAREAKLLKAEGVKAGVPDIIILHPFAQYHGILIELKVGRNKPTQAQETFMQRASAKGYFCAVVRSIDELINILNKCRISQNIST
ncbi:MAG: hypothetical protein KatS3mg031_3006 [Chitinophagales bacterium]|nr:MAG: hypothetical protein KatS3mg031_2907 [Chitinophagales bacterium]GIV35471.1 MAG: hypothetical protein KatS3mg031_3006 [Chitinophagales bacterium]